MKPDLKKEKHYSMSADYLRTLAILAVVFIHTTTKTLEVGRYDVHHLWWALFLNQTLRFAVPLFFLISGFLLELNYKEKFSFFTFFRKRFAKVLIPYLFWSIFYSFFIFHLPLDVKFLYSLLVGDASYQLYFIPTLMIFYLIFPVFHQLRSFLFNKYILSPLIFLELGLLAYDYYFHFVYPITPIRTAVLNYIPFLLGMWASHHKESLSNTIHKYKKALFLLVAFLGIGVFYESYTYFLSTRKIDAIYSQYRPLVLLYTLCLSGFLYVVFEGYTKHKHFFMLLSRLSFFVFFIHVAILYLYWYTLGVYVVNITHQSILQQLWYDPLVFLLVAGVSFFIAFLLSKKLRLAWLIG